MMETLMHGLALLATVAGSACLYLTAPRQLWLPRPLSAGSGRAVGVAGLLEGWLLWAVLLHPVTALFVSLTVAMVLSTALPFAAAAGALARSRQEA